MNTAGPWNCKGKGPWEGSLLLSNQGHLCGELCPVIVSRWAKCLEFRPIRFQEFGVQSNQTPEQLHRWPSRLVPALRSHISFSLLGSCASPRLRSHCSQLRGQRRGRQSLEHGLGVVSAQGVDRLETARVLDLALDPFS